MSGKLEPPDLDPEQVALLAALAERLDGVAEGESEEWVGEFNRLSGLELVWPDFQGVYGAEDHETFVRRNLLLAQARPQDLDRADLVSLFSRILADVTDDAFVAWAVATIERSCGLDGVSDLIFWPDQWFGDGHLQRELTPEELADAILARVESGGRPAIA